jgi:hypothetical protein
MILTFNNLSDAMQYAETRLDRVVDMLDANNNSLLF